MKPFDGTGRILLMDDEEHVDRKSVV